jgi:hypothetical protein
MARIIRIDEATGAEIPGYHIDMGEGTPTPEMSAEINETLRTQFGPGFRCVA